MKRVLFGLCLLASLSLAAPQQKAPGPVTRIEATETFKKVEIAVRIFTAGSVPTYAPKFAREGEVTRAELIREFDRVFETMKPYFVFSPPKVKYDKGVLDPGGPAERPTLEKLVAWGCIARVGPLATGPKPTIDLAEFGDAVGFLLMRMAELSETPSSHWTPAMMYGDGFGGNL